MTHGAQAIEEAKAQLLVQTKANMTVELELYQREYDKAASETDASGYPVDIPLQTLFNLGWCLVHQPERMQVKRGIRLLKEVHERDPTNRQYLHYLAFAHYRLGAFVEAKKWNDMRLMSDAENVQGQAMGDLIRKGIREDGMIMVGVLGGITAVAVGITMMFRRR